MKTIKYLLILLSIVFSQSISAKSLSAKSLSNVDKKCLIDTVYGEARGESQEGQIAVIQVIMNRVDLYNSNVCSVVKSKGQFYPKRATNEFHTKTNMLINKFFGGVVKVNKHVKNATHFHTTSVRPKWSKKLKRKKQIGNHVFYSDNTTIKNTDKTTDTDLITMLMF
jgi:spore germination cell wall hydrolase CwlJ-like protein